MALERHSELLTAAPPGVAAHGPRRTWLMAGSMIAAVAVITALAIWDELGESQAALEDLAQEQATLARDLAADLHSRLAAARRDAFFLAEDGLMGTRPSRTILGSYLSVRVRAAGAVPAVQLDDPRSVLLRVPVADEQVVDLALPLDNLLSGMSGLERPAALMLLVLPPGRTAFSSTDGRQLPHEALRQALEEGRSSLRLAPPDAASLGLPARMALCGLAQVDAGPLGRWGLAVVASALRERDRQNRARWRLVLGLLLVGGLVLAFGGVALRTQRKELDLSRELAIAELLSQRDERLVRAGRAATMGTLAMGITHELSTPLGVIAGRAEQLLSRVAADERATRSVKVIQEQLERVSQVIRGFMGLLRGDVPPAQRVGPASVVRGALALVEHRFVKAGVSLSARLEDALPELTGDVGLLEHAVVNLLLNACDACERGGRVEVSVCADGAAVTITVTDDGCGISPRNAERAAEPFFTTKPPGEGAGLGLAIATEIVHSHRGALTLSPAGRRGTRAAIRLPLPQGEEPA